MDRVLTARAKRKSLEFRRYWRQTFDKPGEDQRWMNYLSRPRVAPLPDTRKDTAEDAANRIACYGAVTYCESNQREPQGAVARVRPNCGLL